MTLELSDQLDSSRVRADHQIQQDIILLYFFEHSIFLKDFFENDL